MKYLTKQIYCRWGYITTWLNWYIDLTGWKSYILEQFHHIPTISSVLSATLNRSLYVFRRILTNVSLRFRARLTQPCIHLGSLNRVPALILIGWGKGRNVETLAGWQIIVCECDPIWHVSSRSSEVCLQTAIHTLFYLLCFVTLACYSVTSRRSPSYRFM